MNENRQSAVVTYTLQALSQKNKMEPEFHKHPQILALLSHHMIGMDRGLAALKLLKSSGATIYISMEDSVLDGFTREDIHALTDIDAFIPCSELGVAKERFSSFFIPVLSFSLISDILAFNDHRPFSHIILWGLLKGRKITALDIGSNPYHSLWAQDGLNHGNSFLKNELNNQMHRLRSFGVKLFSDEKEVNRYFYSRTKDKTIISAENIEQIVSQSHYEVIIDSNTVITPLARDLALKNNIQIREE
ncbi:hypothetical protein HUG15_17525 [Salicibibacter cibarius]|uniref:Uncharacterized protein n=1 Tax=Salicibibacter cibarius TaxID=2743000 RepID=A0A7T6Z5D8_9BACI|nr:hypothetical protein [Salicibibacter cibarius]QQK77200.1 hypothetical protein HUG15_17525 [Salicibibacter cibarius]